jgi:ribosomal-protein-alanine N-acetyltransferase
MQEHFETEQLYLDLLTPDDHEFIRALVNTDGWIRFIGDRNVHSEEAARTYIDKIISNPQIYYWVVRTKEEKTPAGVISFLKRDYLEHYDIGFAFLPEHNGKGYAYEAAKIILDKVGSQPGFHPVLASILPANERSLKLLLKLGLHFEKIITRDNEELHIYSNA